MKYNLNRGNPPPPHLHHPHRCLSGSSCSLRWELYTYPPRKIRLIEVNAKCRHLKKLTCKGTLRRLFIGAYWLGIAIFWVHSVMLVFQPSLVICTLPCCPSHLLSGSPPPTCVNSILYAYTVCKGERGFCWRPYSAGVVHSVSDQIQNLQHCLATPNKSLEEEGCLRKINTCCKVPLQVKFF
jgi:hypothetical protein